ncbi:SDR family oxidoreductase [Streptomyces sclerotialus]|uniref:SDR family oxidoreductase n=1 Tax=Streptomyces sclerotialus TaxID=1957 RepID=UPI00068E01F9
MTTFLVTGGTGTLGRVVVDRLLADGHTVRVLSRRPHTRTEHPRLRSYAVDLRNGVGLADATAGTDVIVHCASTPSGGDLDSAGQLVDAARTAGVRHLVYISIVGVDRVPLRYYRTKREVERLLAESDVPWTVLRTTQFHDLVLRLVKAGARSPVLPAPAGVRVQPVDVREVGARLVELAYGEPAGHVPEMGGPEVFTARELIGLTLRAGDRRRLALPLRLPGATYRALRAGGNLAPEHAVGKIRYADFLAERGGRVPGLRAVDSGGATDG